MAFRNYWERNGSIKKETALDQNFANRKKLIMKKLFKQSFKLEFCKQKKINNEKALHIYYSTQFKLN